MSEVDAVLAKMDQEIDVEMSDQECMSKEELNELCEESWGISVNAILNEMTDFDFDPATASKEECIEFFVTLVNEI